MQMNPYVPYKNTHNCAVMTNIAEVNPNISRLVSILHSFNVAARDHNPDTHVIEEDSLALLVQEAVEHYLGFSLGMTHAGNIGFDYYLDEYFQCFAWYVKQQPGVVNQLGSLFATIVGNVAALIKPGVEQLEHYGQDLVDVSTVVLIPGKTHVYVLEGSSGIDDHAD